MRDQLHVVVGEELTDTQGVVGGSPIMLEPKLIPSVPPNVPSFPAHCLPEATQNCQVGLGIDGLTLGMNSGCTTPHESQKTIVMTFLTLISLWVLDGQRTPLASQEQDCCFLVGLYANIQVLSTVNTFEDQLGDLLICPSSCLAVVTQCSF